MDGDRGNNVGNGHLAEEETTKETGIKWELKKGKCAILVGCCWPLVNSWSHPLCCLALWPYMYTSCGHGIKENINLAKVFFSHSKMGQR